jgi:conjugative relaxase-like TrwC/TraI family protein
MVASISARGGAKSALSYYSHLGRDDYYARDGEPPGRWAGDAAERLTLKGPVTKAEFEAALSGRDPKTAAELVKSGGRVREHAAGWDMTFSAPKSVSVLWALSPEKARESIEAAHRFAVAAGTRHIEATAAWARRGKGGAVREQTAGLLIAKFDHHTSRDLDPQLHTHAFIFNLAPRQDGSWGAIVSRDLYKAQKQAGAAYRNALARELESLGYALEREPARFRVAAIPRSIERAFSKRRQAIEEAARTYGYRTPKGMELAALRTRRAKPEAKLETLHVQWRLEARALGFDLKRDGPRHAIQAINRMATSQPHRSHGDRSSAPGAVSAYAARATLAQSGLAVGGMMRAAEQPTAMPGVAVDLRTGAPPAPPRDRKMRQPQHERGRQERERE